MDSLFAPRIRGDNGWLMSFTAFPQTEESLRKRFSRIQLDPAGMRRPLKPCALAQCHAGCCHDGAVLSDEEGEVLINAARRYETRLWELCGASIETGFARPDGRWRTALRSYPHSAHTDRWLAHFPDTACAWLMSDFRCAWQTLSEETGRHPWHYKPVNCWLHPLTISEQGARQLTVPNSADDPHAAPGYPGFSAYTSCGRHCADGKPAALVLKNELEFLGKILGRDLSREAEEA